MVALCLLSPAKRLEYQRALPAAFTDSFTCSRPRFASEASRIAHAMRAYDVDSLRGLMGVSEQLATRSQDQFQAFDEAGCQRKRAAMYAFNGDTYIGLNAYALDEEAIARAQSTVRILSGLYGLLRPLDEVQPYRLEMGLAMGKVRLKGNSNGADGQVFGTFATPSAWWREVVTRALIDDIRATGASFVVELASREYMAAVDSARLPVPLLKVSFARRTAGGERRLGMAEKRMRGMLAKFIIENQVVSIDEIKKFNNVGFSIDSSSGANECSLRFVKSA